MQGSVIASRDARLALYVLVGVLSGVVFVAFDVLSETRIGAGTLTGILAHVHVVVDRIVPIAVGALLGVCAHYLTLRARLTVAEEAAARADALRLRLHRVERDQAVWVLAAAVLHELNNPLHALGLLLDELGDESCNPRDRSDLVNRAREQVKRALTHLSTLRSIGNTGDPEFEDVAVHRVVQSIADDVEPLATERGVTVRVEHEGPVVASADPTYLRTIIENLVDNSLQALKGVESGRITIRLESEAEHAVVRVTDDGAPLDASVTMTLFEPLRSTKRQGLGLGLPIARALARAMRGEVLLEETDQKTFRLVLPARSSS